MSKIILGDCLEVMRGFDDNSVDLVVTDPPYLIVGGGRTNAGGFLNRQKYENAGNGKMFDNNSIKFREWLPSVYRVLKENSHAYIMVSGRRLNDLTNAALESGFIFQNLLVWDKGNVTPNRYYMQRTEFILLLRKGAAKDINARGTHNILNIPNIIGSKTHPTEKPVPLISIFIKNSSNIGDTVLDPFLGTGSTAVSSRQLDRNYIGIEINPDYVKIAEDRLKQEVLL